MKKNNFAFNFGFFLLFVAVAQTVMVVTATTMALVAVTVAMAAVTAGAGHVNLNGSWIGAGKIVANGQTYNCPNVTFQFQQSANSLKVLKGDYNCDGNVTYNWNAEEIQLDGNDVKVQNQKVGTINSNTLEVSNNDGQSATTIKMTVNQNTLSVSEIEQNANGNYEASAQLNRQ